jgi:hypothetical protein
VHEICDIGYEEWCCYTMRHINGNGITKRLIFVAKTDTGLEGIGEYHDSVPAETVQRYIGTSPFEWVADATCLPLGMAMYDLMGKITGQPCHRLFGPMSRRWVPVSAWFVATTPAMMATAVRTYAEQGHTWMKYHVSPFHNVIEQTEAMQAVAPEGFQARARRPRRTAAAAAALPLARVLPLLLPPLLLLLPLRMPHRCCRRRRCRLPDTLPAARRYTTTSRCTGTRGATSSCSFSSRSASSPSRAASRTRSGRTTSRCDHITQRC